jgi:non-canonical poly(A) RNA polymerase PAPD5/7
MAAPPWLVGDSIDARLNPFISLHNEIVRFSSWMQPTPTEVKFRDLVICKIEDVLANLNLRVFVFGSTRSGFLLPISDLDLSVQNYHDLLRNQSLAQLVLQIKIRLISSGITKSTEFVAKAKVPVLKFLAFDSISVDLAFNSQHESGPSRTTEYMLLQSRLNPYLRPFVLILKIILKEKNLNEAFCGGLGSFACSVLILNFLKTTKHELIGGEKSMAHLLMDFFGFFGEEFREDLTGFTSNGTYCSNVRKSGISMKSPCNPSLDIGQPVKKWEQIKKVFRDCRSALESAMTGHGMHQSPSLLCKILGNRWQIWGNRLTSLPRQLMPEVIDLTETASDVAIMRSADHAPRYSMVPQTTINCTFQAELQKKQQQQTKIHQTNQQQTQPKQQQQQQKASSKHAQHSKTKKKNAASMSVQHPPNEKKSKRKKNRPNSSAKLKNQPTSSLPKKQRPNKKHRSIQKVNRQKYFNSNK